MKEALFYDDWLLAMQKELNQFRRSKMCHLVTPLEEKSITGTRWVYKNKLDDDGIFIRNKAKLGVQGYNQEE